MINKAEVKVKAKRSGDNLEDDASIKSEDVDVTPPKPCCPCCTKSVMIFLGLVGLSVGVTFAALQIIAGIETKTKSVGRKEKFEVHKEILEEKHFQEERIETYQEEIYELKNDSIKYRNLTKKLKKELNTLTSEIQIYKVSVKEAEDLYMERKNKTDGNISTIDFQKVRNSVKVFDHIETAMDTTKTVMNTIKNTSKVSNKKVSVFSKAIAKSIIRLDDGWVAPVDNSWYKRPSGTISYQKLKEFCENQRAEVLKEDVAKTSAAQRVIQTFFPQGGMIWIHSSKPSECKRINPPGKSACDSKLNGVCRKEIMKVMKKG